MSILGKWMYNTGDEENWQCDEGEFDTKEEAVAAGIKYFTEPDGYEDEHGERYESSSFDVGLISEPDIRINEYHVIEQAQEQAYEQCGDWAANWLDKLNKEEEKLLSDMLTKTFKEWVDHTHNNPRFFTIKHITEVPLPIANGE